MNCYENFFDINDVTHFERAVLKAKFISAVVDILETDTTMNNNTAYATACSLYERMSDSQLHYHTPVHILAILEFAKMNYLDLKSWEELAIIFHDAIYEPTVHDGVNENCSAIFAQAMLQPYITDEAMDKVYCAILATADHLLTTTDPEFNRILDLDICNFSMHRQNYKMTSSLVQKEYAVGSREWKKGRKEFLTKFLAKGFLILIKMQ